MSARMSRQQIQHSHYWTSKDWNSLHSPLEAALTAVATEVWQKFCVPQAGPYGPERDSVHGKEEG